MHGLYEWCLFCSCLRLIRTRIHQSITDKAIRFRRAMQDFTIYGTFVISLDFIFQKIFWNSTKFVTSVSFLWWNMSFLHVSKLWRDDQQTTNNLKQFFENVIIRYPMNFSLSMCTQIPTESTSYAPIFFASTIITLI